MEENKKIKNIKLTLYIIGILCLMVGVSYATYNLVLKGNKQHQINIGSLTLTYEETNNINVTGDTLKTDEEGIASGNVFNFKVSVNNTTNKEINYIRVLGFNKNGKNYLNKIKKECTIPIYTNFNKDLEYELKVTSIYDESLIKEEIKNIIICD